MPFRRARWTFALFALVTGGTTLQQRMQADGARAAAWAQLVREGVPSGPYVIEDELGRDGAIPGRSSIPVQDALPLDRRPDGRIRDRKGRAVCHIFATSVRWRGFNRWEVVAGWSSGGKANESATYTLEVSGGRWEVAAVADRTIS